MSPDRGFKIAFVNFYEVSNIDHMSETGRARLLPSPPRPWLLSVTERPVALPPDTGECVMIEQPHFDSYSIQARICFGIAIFGVALFALTSTYFMQ